MTRKVAILHGLGGVGKSSIALEYSFQCSKSYTAVIWADASSKASLFLAARTIVEQLVAHYARQGVSLEEIAAFLGLGCLLDADGQIVAGEAEEWRMVRAIKDWLSIEDNGRWLLVLDNYDDISVNIRDLLPTCDTGHVIITSRRSDLQALGRTLEVVEIDERSGISLFLKSANKEGISEGGKYENQAVSERKLIAGIEEYQIATRVVAKLGQLPLALIQAGSFISHRKISLQRYLTLLDEAFKTATRTASDWPSGRQAERAAVLTTWEMSFASLSHPAKELLLLCGFLANGDIPDELFDMESKLRFDWMGEGKTLSFVCRLLASDTQ
jgi:hypothetical protein